MIFDFLIPVFGIFKISILFHFVNIFCESSSSESPKDERKRRKDSVILILCRNEELEGIKKSLISFEKNFNSKYHYPYVFLNDKPWSHKFVEEIPKIISSTASFDQIKEDDWKMPANIDVDRAKSNWQEMTKKGVPYANLESYHNMCRFFSRAFFRQPLVEKYKYYWRIEPDVTFNCEIDFDPFQEMEKNGWKYGFTISIREFMNSIPTLGSATREFEMKNPQLIPNNIDRMKFMFNRDGTYNGCHFWSNFEIGSFEFFRSPGYQAYINFLEERGGFYYERWGDAPIHSLAAQMFLDKKEIHFFEEIGYTHPPFTHCPSSGKNCNCNKNRAIDYQYASCLPQFLNDHKLITRLQ